MKGADFFFAAVLLGLLFLGIGRACGPDGRYSDDDFRSTNCPGSGCR